MHSSISFDLISVPDMPLADALTFGADAGFHRVGIQLSRLLDDVDGSIEVIRSSGLRVATIGCGGMFTLSDPSLWDREGALLMLALDIAERVEAETVYGHPGPAGGLEWEDAAAAAGQAAAAALAHAHHVGVPLIIEHNNPLYADIEFVHNFREAVDLAEMTGFGLCLDLYPTWQERGLLESARRALTALRLVQVGDYMPTTRRVADRAVLGDGVLPLPRLVKGLLELGFAGPFDMELLGPRIEREGGAAAAVRSGRYLTDLLESLGA